MYATRQGIFMYMYIVHIERIDIYIYKYMEWSLVALRFGWFYWLLVDSQVLDKMYRRLFICHLPFALSLSLNLFTSAPLIHFTRKFIRVLSLPIE